MTGRQPCAVPHCRRTRKDDGRFNEWICDRHWRIINPVLRRRFRRATRKMIAGRAPIELHHTLWQLCREQAIDRAMGI